MEVFNHYITFEAHLFKGIREWWPKKRPEDFVVCNAVGEDYKKCNHTAYSWYMKAVNGRLPTNIYDEISDAAVYKYGKDEVVNRRLAIYESMVNSEDIVMWCLKNIQI